MSLKNTLENIRKAPVPANEEAAKFQILAPILQGLGWNTYDSSHVGFEHTVTTARNATGRVDIALKGSTHTVAHVEAKAPGKELDAQHVNQLLGYGFQEGVYISALTNGFEWQLYLPRQAGPVDQRLFTTFNLRTDPVDRVAEDLLTFLGRDNLISGSSEKRAKQVLQARREAEHLNSKLPEIWSRMLSTPNERLVDLVIEQVYQEINLRPDPKQVTALLRGKPIVPTRGSDGSMEHLPQKGPSGARSKGAKPVAYVLWGHRREVHNWKEILIGLVTRLHQIHSDRILEVKGRKAYASYHEEDIARPSALGDTGIFLHTNLSAENIIKRCHEYLEYLGHSPDDLTIETDEGKSADPAPPQPPPASTTRRAGTKPAAIELWGDRIEVRSWKEVLVGVATKLYRRHGYEFNQILELKGRTRPYASFSPDDFKYGSAEIANSGIHIDTNMSAGQVQRRCAELLELFHHSPDDLTIETR
ncbi:MAG: hypothetical protein F4Z36_02575 [Acidimicrobiia bacterium]|nr:hypothetical protein [Acidimicrobiia bacterium]